MQTGFGGETEYDGNGQENSVIVADVNGDGLPDLIVANMNDPEDSYNGPDGGNVTILTNNGDGTFSTGVTYKLPNFIPYGYGGGASGSPNDVTTADLTGDGRLDIIVADGHGNLIVLPNEGQGVFGTPTYIQTNGFDMYPYPVQVTAVDVNGDGRPDLLVGGGDPQGTGPTDDSGVALVLNNGSGGFGPEVYYDRSPVPGYGVVLGFTTADVNGDGRPDLITLRTSGPGGGQGYFSVLENNGGGGFGTPIDYALPTPASGSAPAVEAIAAGDLNGDLHPDVVVATAATLDVFLNNGSGGYGTPTVIKVASDFTPSTVTLADVNDDGRRDIVVGGYATSYATVPSGNGTVIVTVETNQTEIVLNEGGGTFSAPTTYDGLAASAVADVNGDGKLDLVGSGFYHEMPAGESESVVVALQGPNEPAVCYAAGTRILTRQGEVAVEALREGDEVMTLLGQGFAAVTWLGHHRINLKTHPDPRAVQPVRILAGAFGPRRPARDLRVSPGHALYVDGVLIQAERLVNGATIRREADCETVVYWHVELDRHDVILAEGMPAESYLDTGNRTAFVGGGDFVQLHPDFAPRHWAETCAPMVHEGSALKAAKALLLRRAQDAFGWQVSREPDLHVLADGAAIAGAASGRVHRFALPAGCRELRLVSRRWVPAEMLSGSTDMRVLGVCVRRLVLDGRQLALDDAALSDGWDKPERDDHGAQRWTTGSAVLPPGARSLVVELDGLFAAWSDPEPATSARSA